MTSRIVFTSLLRPFQQNSDVSGPQAQKPFAHITLISAARAKNKSKQPVPWKIWWPGGATAMGLDFFRDKEMHTNYHKLTYPWWFYQAKIVLWFGVSLFVHFSIAIVAERAAGTPRFFPGKKTHVFIPKQMCKRRNPMIYGLSLRHPKILSGFALFSLSKFHKWGYVPHFQSQISEKMVSYIPATCWWTSLWQVA